MILNNYPKTVDLYSSYILMTLIGKYIQVIDGKEIFNPEYSRAKLKDATEKFIAERHNKRVMELNEGIFTQAINLLKKAENIIEKDGKIILNDAAKEFHIPGMKSLKSPKGVLLWLELIEGKTAQKHHCNKQQLHKKIESFTRLINLAAPDKYKEGIIKIKDTIPKVNLTRIEFYVISYLMSSKGIIETINEPNILRKNIQKFHKCKRIRKDRFKGILTRLQNKGIKIEKDGFYKIDLEIIPTLWIELLKNPLIAEKWDSKIKEKINSEKYHLSVFNEIMSDLIKDLLTIDKSLLENDKVPEIVKKISDSMTDEQKSIIEQSIEFYKTTS